MVAPAPPLAVTPPRPRRTPWTRALDVLRRHLPLVVLIAVSAATASLLIAGLKTIKSHHAALVAPAPVDAAITKVEQGRKAIYVRASGQVPLRRLMEAVARAQNAGFARIVVLSPRLSQGAD